MNARAMRIPVIPIRSSRPDGNEQPVELRAVDERSQERIEKRRDLGQDSERTRLKQGEAELVDNEREERRQESGKDVVDEVSAREEKDQSGCERARALAHAVSTSFCDSSRSSRFLSMP